MATTRKPVADLTEERASRRGSGNGSGRSVRQRARSATPVPDAQDGLFDRVVEDKDLIKALEDRETANAERKTATADFNKKHETAKAKIDVLGLEEGEVVRAGRFRITKGKTGEPIEVSFTTNPSPRTTIKLLG